MNYKVLPTCPHPEIIGHVGEFEYDSWNGKAVKVLRFDDVRTPQLDLPTRYGVEPQHLEEVK